MGERDGSRRRACRRAESEPRAPRARDGGPECSPIPPPPILGAPPSHVTRGQEWIRWGDKPTKHPAPVVPWRNNAPEGTAAFAVAGESIAWSTFPLHSCPRRGRSPDVRSGGVGCPRRGAGH